MMEVLPIGASSSTRLAASRVMTDHSYLRMDADVGQGNILHEARGDGLTGVEFRGVQG